MGMDDPGLVERQLRWWEVAEIIRRHDLQIWGISDTQRQEDPETEIITKSEIWKMTINPGVMEPTRDFYRRN